MTRDRIGSAAYFAALSTELHDEAGQKPAMERVAQEAMRMVPGCDFVGVSALRRNGRVETLAATSPVATVADELQYALNEGPCVPPVWTEQTYLCEDTSSDARWPRWGSRVSEHQVSSVLSVRLSASDRTLGTLNMYASRPRAFTHQDVVLAAILGQHAANALNAVRLVDNLEKALDTRRAIGVAQGVLMAKLDLTLDVAFAVLARYSNDNNVKLHELATYVAAHGGLPPGSQAQNPRTTAQPGNSPAHPVPFSSPSRSGSSPVRNRTISSATFARLRNITP